MSVFKKNPFLLCTFVLGDIVFCNSKEGYFTKDINSEDVLAEVKTRTHNVKSVDIFHCAEMCLLSMSCNAFFYNRKEESCSIPTDDTDINKHGGKTDWVLWTGKHHNNASSAISAPKVPLLLIFDKYTRTRILNLDTEDWFVQNTDNYRCRYVGSAVYDPESQTLFWAHFAPNTLFSAPVRNIQDLRQPRVSSFTNTTAQGVSLDFKRRLLFYLRNKELLSMDLRDNKEKTIASVEGKVEFGYCRTVLEVSKQLVYFHTRYGKFIYKAKYSGGYECYPTATLVVNLHLDETGLRLLWMDSKHEFVWTMRLTDMKMEKLVFNVKPYYVFPLEKELFIWDWNR